MMNLPQRIIDKDDLDYYRLFGSYNLFWLEFSAYVYGNGWLQWLLVKLYNILIIRRKYHQIIRWFCWLFVNFTGYWFVLF